MVVVRRRIYLPHNLNTGLVMGWQFNNMRKCVIYTIGQDKGRGQSSVYTGNHMQTLLEMLAEVLIGNFWKTHELPYFTYFSTSEFSVVENHLVFLQDSWSGKFIEGKS